MLYWFLLTDQLISDLFALCSFTELYVKSASSIVTLHATDLNVNSVTINGEAATFIEAGAETTVPAAFDQRSSGNRLADCGAAAAYATYESVVQQEPHIVINVAEKFQNIEEMCIAITYSTSGGGLLWWDGYAVTDTAAYRPSSWVPCTDIATATVRYMLELTVHSSLVAIGPGVLLKTTWPTADQTHKTYHYAVSMPCTPNHLCFAIGSFNVVPSDLANTTVFIAGPIKKKAHDTINFLHVPFKFYEDVLGTPFPLPALQVSFLPNELFISQQQIGLGIVVLSVENLIDIQSLEQGVIARREIAIALARQWFGVLIRPASQIDVWLVQGLAGWLEEQYFKRYAGKNEYQYRKWQERQAVCTADNGDVPPLAFRMGWKALHGTEELDPSNTRMLKAAAVVCMLERRCGEELFKRHVEGLVAMALHGDCTVNADDFLNTIAKDGGFKKEAPAFKERWIYGCGVPHLTGGFIYHKRSSILELAIRQSGSEAAKMAADVAEDAGVLKVLIKESVAPVEHAVHLGSEGVVLSEIKVNPEIAKIPGRRGGRRKKLEAEAEAAAAAQRAAEQAAAQLPVQWVRLDPNWEWLASTKMMQPEVMWTNQLNNSKDVITQSEAVQGLSEGRMSSGKRNAIIMLGKTLDNTHLNCRVRADAARALGRLVYDDGTPAGLESLLKYYKAHFWEPNVENCAKPVTFSDPGEYVVAQAVITSIARCKGADGHSPLDVAVFLMACLDQWYSQGGYFDTNSLLATICAGIGELKMEDMYMPAVMDRLASDLLKWVENEAALPTPGNCVGRACFAAVVTMATRKACTPGQTEKIAEALQRCCKTVQLPVALRAAAYRGHLNLIAATGGAAAVLQFALAAWSVGGFPPALIVSILKDAAELAGNSEVKVGALQPDTVSSLISAIAKERNAALRHVLFMASQRLAHEPPTLYKPIPYEQLEQLLAHEQALLTSPDAKVARVKLQLPVAAAKLEEPEARPVIRLSIAGGSIAKDDV